MKIKLITFLLLILIMGCSSSDEKLIAETHKDIFLISCQTPLVDVEAQSKCECAYDSLIDDLDWNNDLFTLAMLINLGSLKNEIMASKIDEDFQYVLKKCGIMIQ